MQLIKTRRRKRKIKIASPIIRKNDRYRLVKVEIFYELVGRMPKKRRDIITKKMLNEYCKKVESGEELRKWFYRGDYVLKLIKAGKIKTNKRRYPQNEVFLCTACNCMTKTTRGACCKCGTIREDSK